MAHLKESHYSLFTNLPQDIMKTITDIITAAKHNKNTSQSHFAKKMIEE
jgi:hypothetical protein